MQETRFWQKEKRETKSWQAKTEEFKRKTSGEIGSENQPTGNRNQNVEYLCDQHSRPSALNFCPKYAEALQYIVFGRFVEPKSFITSNELLLAVICFMHFLGLHFLRFTVFYQTCRSYLFWWAYIANFTDSFVKIPAATATSAQTKAKQQSSFDVNKIMRSL